MLQTPHFNKYRNSQYIQFNKAVIDVCEKYNPDTLYIKVPFVTFKTHNEKMETVFVTAQGSTITPELKNEDKNRDNLYIGIKYVIFGYTKHYDSDKIHAATELTAHIKKYGSGIPNLEYNAETAVLHDLIDGIETDAGLTAHTVTLGINNWFTELKGSNNEFNRLYGLRAQNESQKTQLNLKELRDESVKHYRKLVEHFHAASIMHPAPVFEQAENELNEFINKYNNIHRKVKDVDDTEENND